MIRVGVIGAYGRMGRQVCAAVTEDPDLALVAAIDRSHSGEPVGKAVGHPELQVEISNELETLLQAEVEVAVDFTHPDTVLDDIRWCIDHAVNVVVGTTGLTDEDLDEIGAMIEREGGEMNVLVASNFALGAALMERFAAMASRVFPAVEIIELHHDNKADAPSGTAFATARRIQEAREVGYRGPDQESLPGSRGGDLDGIRVHSVRLPGLVAHQEVIFGGIGQTLSIRHDAMDRASFMPGVVLAIKAIVRLPGLTIGLDPILDLEERS